MNQHNHGQRTLISVHGYDGDAHQIASNLPLIEHHKLPIIIMSPEDAPIRVMGPHICRFGGKRAYTGQLSLDRQLIHMKMLLEYDFDFYLMHDSDSICLSPELPQYLYNHSHECFSNEVHDPRADDPAKYPNYHKPLPDTAMQPPYFMSRSVLEKLVAVGPSIVMDPITPFIDWYIVQLCWAAGVQMSKLKDAFSCETNSAHGSSVMCDRVRAGAIFLHAIKLPSVRERVNSIYASKNKKTNGRVALMPYRR